MKQPNFYLTNNLINKSSNINQKILSTSIFQKYLIKIEFEKKENLILDNYFNTQKIPINFDVLETKITKGYSFLSQNYIFKNIFYKKISFINPFFVNYFENKNKVLYLKKGLTSLIKKKNKLLSLMILSPVKGGFTCYSLGLIGFLPGSQMKKKKFKKNLKILNILSFFLKKIKQINLIVWFFIKVGSLIIRFYKNKKDLRLRKKIKFNIVFLAKKYEKKDKQTLKLNKKNYGKKSSIKKNT